MKPVICMDHVSKSFNDKTVLKDVNFSVDEGEIFGLLGPSGAGKTTVINILTGQLRKDRGDSSILGENSERLSDEAHEKIGMVLENSGLYPRLSCYDNLAVFAEIFHLPKTKIKDVLKKVKLEDAIKKPASKLSKGMTQRLVLARAIIHNPKLLFLDEPTSGLDPNTALEIHKLIFELRENGATIFLTTHNMEEATKLCHRVSLLNEGEIVECGQPDALCRKYNTEKSVDVLLKDGQSIHLPCDKSSAKAISRYFEDEMVESIHSSEPNLETVFIKLTGRDLQ